MRNRRDPGDKSAEEKFKSISEANEVISDPKKRKIYDQVGFYSDNIDPATAEAYARAGGNAAGGGFAGGFPGGAQPGGQGGVHFDFGGFDFSDLMDNARGQKTSGGGGSFRDIFGSIFGGGRGAVAEHEGPEPGEEAHNDIDAADHLAYIQAGKSRRLRIAADRIDLPAVARVAQYDMSEDREGDENDYRHRHRPDLALTPPDIFGIEAADRSAAGEQ